MRRSLARARCFRLAFDNGHPNSPRELGHFRGGSNGLRTGPPAIRAASALARWIGNDLEPVKSGGLPCAHFRSGGGGRQFRGADGGEARPGATVKGGVAMAVDAGVVVSQDSEAPRKKQITHIVSDLDGTLLDTERLVEDVCKMIVSNYGKEWDGRGVAKRLGKRPLDAAQALIEDYALPITAEEIYEQTSELLKSRWALAKALPGAARLVQFFKSHGIPVAVASSSPAESLAIKLAHQPGWKDALSVVVAGDEVKEGKPSPEIFLEAARRLKAEPSNCLALEDSPVGVAAAKAAGMEVVAVPSLSSKDALSLYSSADHIISSLLDIRPEIWGLPPFDDWIASALPIEPLFLGGPVIKGFGRGSKVLGIPTANLSTAAFSGVLAEHVCGIYLGWAGLSDRGIYKTVMSVGYNPYFANAEKTVEPWLLHDFGEDFYGEELRLVIAGYIRPESNFPSLEALISRIHEDGRVAEKALDFPPYSDYGQLPYLSTPLQQPRKDGSGI